MAKINLAKAKALVDELGIVEEYSRELKAEVDTRKLALHPYAGRTLITNEFECTVYTSQGQTLDKEKLKKKFGLTDRQLASCYVKNKESTTVKIRRVGENKRDTRKQLLKSAKRKVK